MINLSDVHLFINYSQSENSELHEIVDSIAEFTTLGWAVDLVECSVCGNKHGSIHPIPMKYPCECNKCGQMACNIKDNLL